MIKKKDILFMGLSKSAVAWYRCYLPAIHLECDWVGVVGVPPTLHVVTGIVKGDTQLPRYEDYKVIIIQQPRGSEWLTQINSLRERGIKVLYEVDDYLHGVRKQATHDYAQHFSKEALKEYEMCMRVCDGIICSTEYIARRYAKFNRHVYVCRNGIDMARYKLTRPERSTVCIGWAGATGHMASVLPWLNELLVIMREREDVVFCSIGQPGLATAVQNELGATRAIGVPFTLMESYPAAMTMCDVLLAPAGKSGWYQGKSDLRWLEAAALGIPVIADPYVYPEIEHGVTGFHAETELAAGALMRRLIEDEDERHAVGVAAKAYVKQHRHIRVACEQWFEVASAVVSDCTSVLELARR